MINNKSTQRHDRTAPNCDNNKIINHEMIDTINTSMHVMLPNKHQTSNPSLIQLNNNSNCDQMQSTSHRTITLNSFTHLNMKMLDMGTSNCEGN